MLEITVDEIDSSFAAAKNMNAALKHFLKREVKSGDPLEAFVKEFRASVASGRSEKTRAFIERNLPKRELYFLAIARYVYPEVFTSVIEKIFEAHAEEFNKTYEAQEGGIKVKDAAKFKEIVKKVLAMIDKGLAEANLPQKNFLKKSVMMCVFEPDVLKEVWASI